MIETLDAQINLEKLRQLYQYAEDHLPWSNSFPTLQSGISVALGQEHDLLAVCGGNFSKEKEKLFTSLPDFYQNSYISELKSILGLNIYRLRWMKLSGKSCYSFHHDWTRRLHIPIITSPESYVLFQNPLELVHLQIGKAYLVDTTRKHTAMNTRDESRIHLIACVDE